MSSTPSARPRRAAPANALLFAACVAIWSTNWIAITTQVRTAPVLPSLFWRFLLAFVTLVMVERFTPQPTRGRSAPLAASAAVGVFYYFGGIGLSYVAAESLPSSYLACLSVSVVFFAMAIKRIWQGTPILASSLVGAALSTVGLAVFLLGGHGGGVVPIAGVAIGLAGFLCVAVGAVISERLQRRHGASSLAINRTAIGVACGLYLLAALLSGSGLAVPLTASFLLPLLYLGVVCSALVFVLFVALIGRLGAEHAGYVTFIYPLVATCLSLAVGETELRVGMAAGSLMVVAGCIVGLEHTRLLAATTNTTPRWRSSDEPHHPAEPGVRPA